MSPEHIDKFICAEIPDQARFPRLYALVKRHMVHGPCGALNKDAPCMKEDGACSKFYPKDFVDQTSMDGEGYPTYRRRC